MEALETRFNHLLERLGGRVKPEIYREISKKYGEPQRHYHNLAHIEMCVNELDHSREHIPHPDLVEAAIWFHDIIYDPRRNDNEEKSAEYAANTLLSAGVALETVEKIRAMILATKHRETSRDQDIGSLLDIDLAILGKPAEVFDRYEDEIHREYSWVPEKQYKIGRRRVLEGFLKRQCIYSTEYFREKYEAAARKNLQHSVEQLSL
jgi:predicted metal-dependent HD superfamily phosphohydrolase